MSAISLLQVAVHEDDKVFLGFASEITKQLITISVAIITVSIGFIKDILKDFPKKYVWLIGAAWICIFLSIVSGIIHLMSLTGSIQRGISENARMDIAHATAPAGAQVVLFGLGLLFVLWYGIITLGSPKIKNVVAKD